MNHKRLWAPWRIAYIKKFKKEKGCLFCKAFESGKDEKNFVVFRSKSSLAILNIYPYNNGHIMIAPQKHVRELGQLDSAETADLINCLNKAKRLLEQTLKPEGYNIGINIGRVGGAGIEHHLHIHLVPRWQGDTNFMPAIFNTKIISQSLHELYATLKKKNDGLKRTGK
ncbi:MAG TPA: HIT family hydrolase [Candidatus Omnitrophica bacterium]|nr:HIT family hydrolase [Candidatus Omnitrophota bacterium]